MTAKEAREISNKVNGVYSFFEDVLRLIKIEAEKGQTQELIFCNDIGVSSEVARLLRERGFSISYQNSTKDFLVRW